MKVLSRIDRLMPNHIPGLVLSTTSLSHATQLPRLRLSRSDEIGKVSSDIDPTFHHYIYFPNERKSFGRVARSK